MGEKLRGEKIAISAGGIDDVTQRCVEWKTACDAGTFEYVQKGGRKMRPAAAARRGGVRRRMVGAPLAAKLNVGTSAPKQADAAPKHADNVKAAPAKQAANNRLWQRSNPPAR